MLPGAPKSSLQPLKEIWHRAWAKIHDREAKERSKPQTYTQKYGMKPARYAFDQAAVEEACKAAIVHDDFAFFEEIVSEHKRLSVPFLLWLRGWLVSEDDLTQRFSLVHKGLDVVLNNEDISTKLWIVNTVAPVAFTLSQPSAPKPLLEWTKGIIGDVFADDDGDWGAEFGLRCGPVLADVGLYFKQPFDALMTKVMPRLSLECVVPPADGSDLKKTVRSMAIGNVSCHFVFAFLSRLREHAKLGIYPSTAVMQLHNRFAATFLESGKLKDVEQECGFECDNDGGCNDDITIRTPDRLFELFTLLTLSSPPIGELFINSLNKFAQDIRPTSNLHVIWIPLLRLLLPYASSECSSNGPQKDVYQSLYSKLFTVYEKDFVGERPPRDVHLRKRFELRCLHVCTQCREVNDFLKDGTREVLEMRLSSKTRRKHVRSEIGRVMPGSGDLTCSSRPQNVLVLRKQFGMHDAWVKRWELRRERAGAMWESFDKEQLVEVLGSGFAFMGKRLGGVGVVAVDQGQKRKERGDELGLGDGGCGGKKQRV
ncbi:hypothetical protein B0T21DRAFT_425887 [Apiosordaria backusii]|uniref:Uncharacterized protein n=1 Tax=Apiosordaria backusii TaxID=314023 RepID=A0AA40AIP2_9PEZI|nr:hypothetical protein B0T21DRAFT_425887 [Apiosordaria backusii]